MHFNVFSLFGRKVWGCWKCFAPASFFIRKVCGLGEKCLGNFGYYPLSVVLLQTEYKGKILCSKQHIVLKGSQKYKKMSFLLYFIFQRYSR